MSTAIHGLATRFRTCDVTGLKVNWHAETLVKVNAVVAVVNFLIGLIAAFGVVMTRWQAVHLLPADLDRRAAGRVAARLQRHARQPQLGHILVASQRLPALELVDSTHGNAGETGRPQRLAHAHPEVGDGERDDQRHGGHAVPARRMKRLAILGSTGSIGVDSALGEV